MSAHRARIAPGGRVVIPAPFRRALGLEEGDPVVIELGDGELRIRSLKAELRKVQERFRGHLPPGRSLADELIRERREEAAREEGG
ncbi:MAG TPA: AbrB/MazE/SpoVT family DNA-binding domain-containing protein [Geminicoccaceae bacterium]